ncbi:MAG: FkbM family methyltransferase [Albidovulum sp.]|nr:FkbM family methyltransferase [Albidovulum sp.]
MIRQIANHIAKVRIFKLSEEYLTEYPQLAIFSYDNISNYIQLRGRYENDELTYLENHIFPRLKPGICLDIGANIGNHSVAFAPFFQKVIAFEPNPRTFMLLAINADLYENIEPLNLGASSTSAIVEAKQSLQNIGATSVKYTKERKGSVVEFKLVPIDDVKVVQASEPITFIKLDVEGHELQALKGAEKTIRKYRPIIAMEVLPLEIQEGITKELRFLSDLGYNNFYEFREAGWLGKTPRKVKAIIRTLTTLVTGKRPSKAGALVPLKFLEKRSYAMVLCSFENLGTES